MFSTDNKSLGKILKYKNHICRVIRPHEHPHTVHIAKSAYGLFEHVTSTSTTTKPEIKFLFQIFLFF